VLNALDPRSECSADLQIGCTGGVLAASVNPPHEVVIRYLGLNGKITAASKPVAACPIQSAQVEEFVECQRAGDTATPRRGGMNLAPGETRG
jgi:hypothetical protein